MSGRKTIVGVAVLCALAFSAFGAASASAAHTTAFTCDPSASTKDFDDAHCDTKSGGAGSFGHTAIAADTSTEIIGSNITTGASSSSWKLHWFTGGITIEITCAKVGAMGSIKNDTVKKDITGETTLDASECKVLKPEAQSANCTVTYAGQAANSTSEGMGTKFTPVGESFALITIANAPGKTCKGVAVTNAPVAGTAFAEAEPEAGKSHSGATLHFTTAGTEKTLIIGGSPAKVEGTLTQRMGPTATPGNPIVATTVA